MSGPDEPNRASLRAVDPGVLDGQLDVVAELARQVTGRRDLADVLAATLAGLRKLVAFGGGSIQLLDDEGWIRVAAADPPASEDVLGLRIPLGSTVAGRVILTERPVYLPDVLGEPNPLVDDTPGRPAGMRSYLGVPLLVDGHAAGLLQIDSAVPDAWSPVDRLLFCSAAAIVAAAIQNARAHARVNAALVRQRRTDAAYDDVKALLEVATESLTALSGSTTQPHDRAELGRVQQSVAAIRVLLEPDEDAKGPRADAPTDIDLRTDHSTSA